MPDVGLEPTTTRLKVLRSTDWANRACLFSCVFSENENFLVFAVWKHDMAAVGFEPTRTNTGHLKCLPLDQLGQTACDSFEEIYQLFGCCGIRTHAYEYSGS